MAGQSFADPVETAAGTRLATTRLNARAACGPGDDRRHHPAGSPPASLWEQSDEEVPDVRRFTIVCV